MPALDGACLVWMQRVLLCWEAPVYPFPARIPLHVHDCSTASSCKCTVWRPGMLRGSLVPPPHASTSTPPLLPCSKTLGSWIKFVPNSKVRCRNGGPCAVRLPRRREDGSQAAVVDRNALDGLSLGTCQILCSCARGLLAVASQSRRAAVEVAAGLEQEQGFKIVVGEGSCR